MVVSVSTALAGNWYAANIAGVAGKSSCKHKLTGEKAMKIRHDERMKSSTLTDEEAMKEEALKVRHEEWMKKHKRKYKDEAEKARRFEIFKATVEYVEKFNAEQDREYGASKSKCVLGTNRFADFTDEEYRAWLCPTHENLDVRD